MSTRKTKSSKVWTCSSGEVILSDPCYGKSTRTSTGMRIAGELPILKGNWKASVEYEQGRIATLITWHTSIRKPKEDSKWVSPEFSLGVDSGQAGIFDKKLYPTGEETGEYVDPNTFYGKCCDITLKDDPWGIVDGEGVVCESGFGDGYYGAYYHMNEEGRIVGLRIEFITDESSEE